VQGSLSLQLAPLFSVTAHDAVPLQVRVVHASLVHVMALPAQAPAAQLSPYVHGSPSLQPAPSL
jgi:hypothetical protein